MLNALLRIMCCLTGVSPDGQVRRGAVSDLMQCHLISNPRQADPTPEQGDP